MGIVSRQENSKNQKFRISKNITRSVNSKTRIDYLIIIAAGSGKKPLTRVIQKTNVCAVENVGTDSSSTFTHKLVLVPCPERNGTDLHPFRSVPFGTERRTERIQIQLDFLKRGSVPFRSVRAERNGTERNGPSLVYLLFNYINTVSNYMQLR